MNTELIKFPCVPDKRGSLSFIEDNKHIPFKIKRVYWIYDVPGGATRGSHAFYTNEECIIALSGSFEVVLHNGVKETSFTLNRSYHGILVPKLTWRKIENFSTNSLALILASTTYMAEDYIRDFHEFLTLRENADKFN